MGLSYSRKNHEKGEKVVGKWVKQRSAMDESDPKKLSKKACRRNGLRSGWKTNWKIGRSRGRKNG